MVRLGILCRESSDAARTSEELISVGPSRQSLVINGVLAEHEADKDPLAAAIHRCCGLNILPHECLKHSIV